MIDWRRLFPPTVIGTALGPGVFPDALHPAEEAYLRSRRMSGRREDDFRRGRTCARRALRGLGLGEAPILISADRDPLWPGGVVGSITHTEGLAAAVVASDDQILGVGVDAERLERAGADLASVIASAGEAALWSSAWIGGDWLTALFSAKESVFKATFPRTRTFLEFHDVILTPSPDGHGFTASAGGQRTDTTRLTQISGRVVFHDRHVVTGAWWRADRTGELGR